MKVQVNHVKAHITRPHCAHDRVQVRPVIIAQSAALVYDICDLQDIFVKQAHCVGVGQHQARHIGPGCLPQLLNVHAALCVGRNSHHRVACHGRAGRVGAVGRVGDEDLGPFAVLSALVVGLDEEKPGKFTVSPRRGLEGHAVHTGDLAQVFLRQVQHLHASLHRVLSLERMDIGKSGKGGHRLVDPGIVFHCTGAQGIKAVIDPVGLPRKLRVVPGYLHLGQGGQMELLLPSVSLRQAHCLHIAGRKLKASSARSALFKY